MKTTFKTIAIVSFLTSSVILTHSCEKNTNSDGSDMFAPFLSVSADGTSSIIEEKMLQALMVTAVITDDETNSLVNMREEEKLARDVYYALKEKWGNITFTRISIAENNHMTALNTLLKAYGSSDTVITEKGVFTNQKVQELYNGLVTSGSVSLIDAFKIGALIEEMDINDIQDLLNTTDNENIKMVFDNLERGSRNHLRAFTRQLKLNGLTYNPVYISLEEYNSIINNPVESGNHYRMNRNAVCIRNN
jgi:hypothetical protein